MRSISRMAALTLLLAGSAALAQQPVVLAPIPRLTTIFPMGAKAGTTVEVTVNGTDLDEPEALVFSHAGIKAEYVPPVDPKPDPKAKNPDMGKKKKGGVPTTHQFKVTVPADVPPGTYDVRIASKFGVSNPRSFVVGSLPEVLEKEPNNDVPEAQKLELGNVVNGTVASPQDVDYYAITGKAGQRILAHCATSSIDGLAQPLLEMYAADGRRLGANRGYDDGDALLDVTLPADGEYQIRLCEFAYQSGSPNHFYRLTVGTGPWVDAVFPPAINPGKPTQVTLFGRNLPGGKPVDGLTVDGRPVESVQVTVSPPSDPAARTSLAVRGVVNPKGGLLDGFEYRLPSPSGPANPVTIYFTDSPVVAEAAAANDTLETAQVIPAPCEVAGRIEKRHDRDFYKFAAKKGDVFIIEMIADRMGSGIDGYFAVRNEKGDYIGSEQDDDPDALHPNKFYNRSGDPPALKFTAPVDGNFVLLVGSRDAAVNYGPRCLYRFRVAKPAPDFRAVAMAYGKDQPAAPLALADGDIAIDVFAERRDGFDGPITVNAVNLPAGVTAKPGLIGSGAKWGSVILSTAANAAATVAPISIVATATIDGKPVTRTARTASITWAVQGNQNVPTISRLQQQFVMAVRPTKATFRLSTDLAGAKVKSKDKDGKETEVPAASPLFVKPGDKVTIPVKVAWQDAEARANPLNIVMEATQPNNNAAPVTVNNNQPVPLPKDKNDGSVTLDVKPNAPPGAYSVQLRGDTLIQYLRDPAMKDKKTPVTVLGYASPITVTVLPTALVKLTATAPPALKPGDTGELVLKLERLNDFAGELKVKVTFPKEATGLSAKEVTVPAGATEVKVPVTAAADAKPGTVQNAIVTAVGKVHEKFDIPHDAKFNVTVNKAK